MELWLVPVGGMVGLDLMFTFSSVTVVGFTLDRVTMTASFFVVPASRRECDSTWVPGAHHISHWIVHV